ncbi:MAG TPA: hydrogenase iron-sulfur subunit [Thermoplasmatales archaeon]|nr:hydrogenase iron-sulfur subunit [Thermoplasmatales archaeon]
MSFEPKIVAMLCNWCSYAGADLAGVSRFQYPPTTRVIRVMCSTRVEPSFVLKSFLNGADGVLVGGCHLGDCHYVTGNYYTIGKMNMARKLLKYAGIDEKRLRLEWVSASEGEKFASVVTDFTGELKELGPLGEETKNSLALRAAFNVSLKPRIRILATKERMLTVEGNKYGEIYTPYEFDRISDEIVWDEINEEKIRLLLQQNACTLLEIAEKTGLKKETVFLYLMDFIKRGEASFREEDGTYVFYHDERELSIPEPLITGKYEGKEGVVVIGAGADGLNRAIAHAENGENVVVIERHPAINRYTVRKYLSSLDKEIPLEKFVELVKKGAITVLTNSWVRKIADGSVKVVQYPGRVNENCNNCNVCYEVCPLKTVDRERTLFSRKAAYGIRGIPTTYALEKETPFCQTSCPAHLDIRGYVAKIAEGKFQDSVDIIRERLVLPAVLGRICPHPCEEMCRRNAFESPISIRLLKRFVADWEWEKNGKIDLGKKPANENNNYKVAIIGSGPAGLTVAYELTRKGYTTTIFEALPVAGGMLAVGIPSYRLPKDVLKREIDAVLDMGVELQLNTRVGKDISFEELQKEYDAIFVGVGAHECRKLGIDGEECRGSIPGVDFLREVNISPETVRGRFQDKRVIVIGGGDVAIDAARCALRLGSREVTMVYRRSRKEMPARDEEIEAAEEEGVTIKFMAAPTRILEKNGAVAGIECVEMELGEPDESGRRRPIPKEGSEFILDGDIVVAAIGQYSDFSFLPEEIEKTKWGIVVDDATAATSVPGVFAGGDAVTGPSIAIDAVAWGRRAAHAIDAYLHGREVAFDPVERDINRAIVTQEDIELMKRNVVLSGIETAERKEISSISIEERIETFDEVEKGYDDRTAMEEAKRCLSCRECLGCGICGNECVQNAIDYDATETEIEVKAKEVVIDPEIYFTVDKHSFTPFEVEDMLELGLIMNWDGRKPTHVAVKNGSTRYIQDIQKRLEDMGITPSDDEADMVMNCSFNECEYYQKLRKHMR